MLGFMVMGLVSGWSLANRSNSVFPGGARITQPRWILARGILESGRTRSVSFQPFPNSSGWWWLISSIFPIRISCRETTHANGYYGAWPGWAVSISVPPLHFQELFVHSRTVTILYQWSLLLFSSIFLILPQYIVVLPVPQDLSWSKASAVKGFPKVPLFWLDSQPADYLQLLYSHPCCALCNA